MHNFDDYVIILKQVQPEHVTVGVAPEKVGLSISMNSINGGFGFRIVGGRDVNAEMIPQVDLVATGKCTRSDQSVFVCCHATVSYPAMPITYISCSFPYYTHC